MDAPSKSLDERFKEACDAAIARGMTNLGKYYDGMKEASRNRSENRLDLWNQQEQQAQMYLKVHTECVGEVDYAELAYEQAQTDESREGIIERVERLASGE